MRHVRAPLKMMEASPEMLAYENAVLSKLAPDSAERVRSAYSATVSARLTLDPRSPLPSTLVSRDAYEMAKEDIIRRLPAIDSEAYKAIVHMLEKSTPDIPWKKNGR
jgi:hypothetical protein